MKEMLAKQNMPQERVNPIKSVMLEQPYCWLQSALTSIDRLKTLPLNWDGYGSKPPSATQRKNAVWLLKSIRRDNLPKPNVVPVSGGGIQFEWIFQGRELELEMMPKSEELLFLKVYEDGTMEENSYPFTDLNKTHELLDWLLTG